MSSPQSKTSKSFAFESSPEFLLYSDPKLSLISSQYATKATLFQSDNSIVYLVNHHETEKPYTLKAIRKMAGVNFDFSAFQHLDHPNLVPLTEHLESEHFHILIKPYVSGIDLHTYVQKQGPLRGTALSALIDQLTSAIAYLHNREKALIFRDLKPSNIIVSETQTGLKFTIIDIETMRKTQTDKTSDTYFVLSHGFSSPEQYGYQQSDPRSDIYSLGATLFYAITGEKPDLKSNLYRQLLKQQVPVSRATALAIDKCLSFDPARRFRTIKHFKMALRYPNLLSMLKRDGLVASAAFAIVLIFSIAFGYANARLGENDPGAALTDNTAPSTAVAELTEPSVETEATDGMAFFEETTATEETTSNEENSSTDETAPLTTAPSATMPVSTVNDGAVNTTQNPMETATEAVSESTSMNAGLGTYTLNQNAYPIISKKDGVILVHLYTNNYHITIDPNAMPAGQEDVSYMSIFSMQDVPDSAQINALSNQALTLGHGFHPFDYRYGYNSILGGNHYLVLLYNKDSRLVGYRIFKNITTNVTSTSSTLSSNTLPVDAQSEGRTVTLAEGVSLDVRTSDMTLYVDRSKLPDDQKDLAGVVIMGNVRIGDQLQLDHIIEEIEVAGRYIRTYRDSGVTSGYGGLTFDTQSWYIMFVSSQQKVTRVISVN